MEENRTIKGETEKLMNDNGNLPRRDPFKQEGFNPIKRFIEESLKHEPKEWAEQRKFDLYVLKTLGIGYAPTEVYSTLMNEDKEAMLHSPLVAKGQHKYVNCVIIKVDDEYFIAKPQNKKNLFLTGKKKPWFVAGTDDTCYITEGETDAIRLHHVYPTSATFSLGGVGDTKSLKELRKYFNGKKVILAFDNDSAGQEAIPKAVKDISKNYPPYEIYTLSFDKKFKDVDEFFRDGGDINSIILEKIDNAKIEESTPNQTRQKNMEEIDDIREGVDEGKRNESCFILAKYYKKRSIDFQTTQELMGIWNKKNRPPLDEKEVDKIVKRVFDYQEKKPPTALPPAQTQLTAPPPKPEIILPYTDKLISAFSREICAIIKNKLKIFYKPRQNEMVEIIEDNSKDKKTTHSFQTITPDRFINIVEEYVDTGIEVYDKTTHDFNFKKQSISPTKAKTAMANSCWKDDLPKIERILTTPIPIIYEGQLTFPKKGYDERFNSWVPLEAPDILDNVDLEEAKKVLKYIYNEFCFKDKQSYTNAVAQLFTQFCQGLYPKFNTRTPIFFWEANRERAGKDYGAIIPTVLFDGIATQDPPISTTEKGNNSDELRKKITTMLKAGRRRFHSANNRGNIHNEMFEALATLEIWSDRNLGSNTETILPNELFLSLSANTGYTASPDFVNRCRFVRLHLEIEDANQRKFHNPNLHIWVIDNREKILGALYTFIKEWFNNGKQLGKTPFTSFPQWAQIVGGIMEHHNMGNPCITEDSNFVSGDRETVDMKTFFEICYEAFKEEWKLKTDMIQMLRSVDECRHLFPHLEIDKRSGEIGFAFMIDKYVGRIFSGIKLIKDNSSKRSSRHKFKFIIANSTDAKDGEVDIFSKTEIEYEDMLEVDSKHNNVIYQNIKNEKDEKVVEKIKENIQQKETNIQNSDTKCGNDGNDGNVLQQCYVGVKGYIEPMGNITNITNITSKNNDTTTKPIVVVSEVLDVIPESMEVTTQWLITYFGGSTAEKDVMAAIEILRKQGDIFMCKPDVWKKL